MKKARSKYHYLLRALKKEKHCKTKISISKSMLRSNKSCYWKASRVIRKNNFNCTNVVDGDELSRVKIHVQTGDTFEIMERKL